LLPDTSGGLSASTDPRLTFASLYRNVRPEVKYVGDESCARCHAGLARSYRQHPMGRSLAAVAALSSSELAKQPPNADFRAQGFHYRVERRGNQIVHREMKEDPHGRVLAETEAAVRFVVGSGTRGRSYLVEHDGYLFQSPITWYPQQQRWDLSPGYAVRNHHFARPVPGECLFCHSNYADEVADTVNHYRAPIFRGLTIGCERCHGPGELHVRRHERAEEPADVDPTIVNPRHLEPALRDAVCEQCHLQGDVRILRRGRGTFDYRPGLPLHLFMSVFVRPASQGEARKFVGHVEQMHASRCFVASGGKMGCITCHDPHRLPAASERVDYYRDRCLTCHGNKDCTLPANVRLQTSTQDSCIDCHMPVGKSSVPHASITDHSVPRKVEPPPRKDLQNPPQLNELPLVYFHRDLAAPKEMEPVRELGIALMDRIERYPERIRQVLGQRALPLLEAALRRDDADLPAWQAKAYALWVTGRTDEAAAAFELLLSKAPLHEAALHGAANLAMDRMRAEAACNYWERVIRVNPWRYEFHYGLAAARAQMRNWTQAVDECQQALRLTAFKWEARKLLIGCYLALGAKDHARREFELLLALEPREPAALQRWYNERENQP
jgi:Flp pilus assembly protein TadD